MSLTKIDPNIMAPWMEERGGRDLWKMALYFDKGEDIASIEAVIEERDIPVERKLEINPNTAKKFVRDWVDGGGELPPEGAAKVSQFVHAVIRRK
jgi:hypothetical protein